MPGVLLHGLNNSAVLLTGHYAPQLIKGWLTREQKHLPGWLLAAVAVTLCSAWKKTGLAQRFLSRDHAGARSR